MGRRGGEPVCRDATVASTLPRVAASLASMLEAALRPWKRGAPSPRKRGAPSPRKRGAPTLPGGAPIASPRAGPSPLRPIAPLLASVALTLHCTREEPTVVVPAPSASAVAPVDHLAEGELLEGDAKAFGLVLPRGVTIAHGFDDLMIATGDVPADKVANYVRQRVKDGKITVGARGTVFEGVKSAGAPDLELSVRVEPNYAYEGVRMEIRRLTQPKAEVLPDEEARWRAAGLKPNGEVLDPKKLH